MDGETAMKTKVLLVFLIGSIGASAQTPGSGGSDQAVPPAAFNNVILVDGKNYTTCAAAIAAAGTSKPTLIIQPSNYVGPVCKNSTLPSNVTLLDLTKGGTLTFNTNMRTNPTGQSVGLEINAGEVPPNPGPGNVVAFVPQISCPGIPCWVENPVAYLAPSQPDTYVRGAEYDIDIGYIPSQQRRGTAQYIGLDAVSGWNYQPTFGFRTNAVPGEASWQTSFYSEIATYNAFAIYPNVNSYKITKAITNTGEQNVATNGTPFKSPLYIGEWISIDSGPRHEDVRITSLTPPNLLGGHFTKTHLEGTIFYTYTTDQFWNPSDSVSREYAYLFGNIQSYNQINATNPLGWSVINASGTNILYDYFDSSNSRHFRDAGSNGWVFENSSGAQTAFLANTGLFQPAGYALTTLLNSNSVPVVDSGFGDNSSIGSANGTASFTIDVGGKADSSSITLTMPQATNGWNCVASDKTAPGNNLVRQSGGSTTKVTLTNYTNSGIPMPPAGSDVIGVLCGAY
jgi:hypothetical protein